MLHHCTIVESVFQPDLSRQVQLPVKGEAPDRGANGGMSSEMTVVGREHSLEFPVRDRGKIAFSGKS